MELRQIRNEMKPNPELEAIRNRVLKESAIKNNEWITELIKRTCKIHAGFLFEDRKALQDLCLFISETQNKLTDSGWEAFGHHLGLNPCVLKVINHNNFNKEDPTYNTLLAYVQFDNATIGKLIQALWDIGRLDVISRIRKPLNDLVDIIIQHAHNSNYNTSSTENSDYGSLQLSNERNIISSTTDSDILGDNINSNRNLTIQTNNIIKPVIIPPAPFIFQNIKATPECTLQRIQQSINSRETLSDYQSNGNISECYTQTKIAENDVIPCAVQSVQTSADTQTKVTSTKKRYGKTVMLTFAPDGEKYAEEICKILRRDRDKYPRIGVLVLSEHAKDVMKDPQRFITGVFHQIDYICPILTDSYFNLIRRKGKSAIHSDLHLDARYAQFVYALMTNYYVSNGCLNDKIRCIIPDELVSKIRCNLLMSIPIFSAWCWTVHKRNRNTTLLSWTLLNPEEGLNSKKLCQLIDNTYQSKSPRHPSENFSIYHTPDSFFYFTNGLFKNNN